MKFKSGIIRTEQLLLEKIKRIYETPGGKKAAALIIEKLAAESFTGDVLDPNYVYKVGDRNILMEDLEMWLKETDSNLEESFQILEGVLNQPTKENFLLLLGEALSIQIPFLMREDQVAVILAKLNPDTLKEFEIFERERFISINTNPVDLRLMSMRGDNKIFEDKKRDMATGHLCAIQLNKSLYGI